MATTTKRLATSSGDGSDPVATLLRARGCPERTATGGLAGLLEDWERIVAQVAGGYGLGLDDYLNDMDARQLLADTVVVASPSTVKRLRPRLEAADNKLKALLLPAGRCLWGKGLAERNGWLAEKNWWYFSRPKEANQELLQDIGSR